MLRRIDGETMQRLIAALPDQFRETIVLREMNTGTIAPDDRLPLPCRNSQKQEAARDLQIRRGVTHLLCRLAGFAATSRLRIATGRWANPLVEQATRAVYEKVFSVFGVITLAVVGLYLMWRSRQADMGAATTTGGNRPERIIPSSSTTCSGPRK